jgi:Ni,Fe-hydrogenase III small subunit/ferredoxin
MVWVFRGLRDGIVTTGYPRRPDGYGAGFRGVVSVLPNGSVGQNDGGYSQEDGQRETDGLCPTGAIDAGGGRVGRPAAAVAVDRGRCILCGRCVADRPERFAFSASVEAAAIDRSALVVPHVADNDESLARLRAELHRRVRLLRRSVHIRHVDAGSDGSEEWEIAALVNPIYDVQRLGISFTASPRHADILLVTGTGTAGMSGPLQRTFEAMPAPKVVIAAGTDAISGGLVHPTYASGPGIGSILPVDVWIPGSPPSPFTLLHGILVGIGLLPEPELAG